MTITGWGVALVFGALWGLQWRSSSQAAQRLHNVQASCAELSELHWHSQARFAEALTRGLRLLREGEAGQGYELLDTLVRVSMSNGNLGNRTESILAEPREYLDAVGDPFMRRQDRPDTAPGTSP